MARQFRRNPLALAILTLLHEAPMHPYRMQRLIKDRAKENVINVGQRASLYQTVKNLLRAGLISPWEREHEGGFPERTIYKLTNLGHRTALEWLRGMLSTPAQEYPEFPAAVSLLPLLTPDDARVHLEIREGKLVGMIAELDEVHQESGGSLPRLFLLESEYMRLMLQTELGWVRSIIEDLRDSRITWTDDWSRPTGPPSADE